MAEQKKYTGGCHCGKVRFEATTDLSSVIECNCSICTKRGLLLSFVPSEQFAFVAGNEAALKDYQFNKKVVHHLFCPDCGIESFGTGQTPDGRKMYAVNVRCLDGVDLASLKRTPVDGRSR
ncbi:GFA family protein [Archangium minus]|uniref:GFA family protein n=1 Tax=Archangium minus TaxID=83450 RepID=A0ABY9X481_9BACT|nr:GFA family protein [Archangium violaceum]WNG50206.1 GFA family protein [Archangium minus]